MKHQILDVQALTAADKAEIMRKRSRYRELILSGRLVLPPARAAQLLGPDTLYRLYSAGLEKAQTKGRYMGTSR